MVQQTKGRLLSLIPFVLSLMAFSSPALAQTTTSLSDGWTIKDSGNREVKVEGGDAEVKWEGSGTPDRDRETKTITLPANSKITKVNGKGDKLKVKGTKVEVDNDKKGANVTVEGDDNKLKIDKPGTYTTSGDRQGVTVDGGSAGDFTGNFTGNGTVTTNGVSTGTVTTNPGQNGGTWVHR